MSKVFTGPSMSLDGYISGPGETGFEGRLSAEQGLEVTHLRYRVRYPES